MGKISAVIILVIALFSWQQFRENANKNNDLYNETHNEPVVPTTNKQQIFSNTNQSQFRCDGRTHCSQMTSCAEATFFINNYPNTKMDGNKDGIPCEKQWCK